MHDAHSGRSVARAAHRAAFLIAASCLIIGCARSSSSLDVLLVILDTTRADHFSSYGYPRRTTPNFDRLAAEGERFDNAWAQSSWTLPAIASLLTGQPPHVHGAGRSVQGTFPVRPEVPTLAEDLRSAGYRTAAFVNVSWLSPQISGLDRGFDSYDLHMTDPTNRNQREARATTDAALAWLESERTPPFFLVVHYFDAHLTYDPPPPYDTRFEPDSGPRIPPGFGSANEVRRLRLGEITLDARRRESLIARYDGEIAHVDAQFGRLRAGLERMGRWDRTLVIVVGDHGEEFWDHGGFEHGHSHHREVLRVPLIVRRPGGPSSAVHSGRVRQIDVAPAVLAAAGLGTRDLPGTTLDGSSARYAVAEGTLWDGDLVSVRSDDGMLQLDRKSDRVSFYASGDEAEASPIDGMTAPAAGLLGILRALPTDPARTDRPNALPPEQLDQLRSLGYLGE
jgi:arylsulfatase A-like enzyme